MSNTTSISDLKKFLTKNKGLDLASVNLKDEDTLSTFKWDNKKADHTALLKLLQAYQRISKLLPRPEDKLTISLLKDDINSALVVASISKEKFLANYANQFETHGLDASAFYENAATVKTNVLLEYMRLKQQGEPHISQTNLQSKI